MLQVSDDREWTYEDYCQLPEDGNRYEVIEGKLYMSPSPRTLHQTLSKRLMVLFYELEQQGRGFIFAAPTDLLMPGCTPVVPDLIYLDRSQRELIKEKYVEGAPTLLIEILSPGTAGRDRTLKLNRYARSGVPHYWIVDPAEQTLELYRLEGDAYRVEAALGPGDTFRPQAFPGIELKLDELFAPL